MNANEGVCVRLNVIHTASNWAAKRCKTGAGSLPNQNNLEECQTLHVLRTHCMHGLVQWGEVGRGEGSIKPILTTVLLPEKLSHWKTVNDLW